MDDDLEWLDIPGFPGYSASNAGDVKGPSGRVLSPALLKVGYLAVNAHVAGHSKTAYVHRLIALAFHGEPRSAHLVVRHLDGDKLHNTPENLCWGTESENEYDTVRHGNHFWANKTECPVGHPYDAANTYRSPSGKRECRICRDARRGAYLDRRQGIAEPLAYDTTDPKHPAWADALTDEADNR